MGIPEHLICLILYVTNRSYVRVEDELSINFNVSKGVRQGCILSAILFNIYGEWIIRKVTENWNGGVSIGGKLISNLRYADDTTIIANSEEEMALLLQKIETASTEVGLRLNRAKCQLMIVNRAGAYPQNPQIIHNIEVKNEVIYLGALISNKGGEIKRRLGLAKSAMGRLIKIWKDHHISKYTKMRLVRTIIFPIATYGSETWTLNAACRKRIEAFEMTCWRKMLQIHWTARRTNQSIIQELKISPKDHLLANIQRRILKYFGHVIRSDVLEKLTVEGRSTENAEEVAHR